MITGGSLSPVLLNARRRGRVKTLQLFFVSAREDPQPHRLQALRAFAIQASTARGSALFTHAAQTHFAASLVLQDPAAQTTPGGDLRPVNALLRTIPWPPYLSRRGRVPCRLTAIIQQNGAWNKKSQYGRWLRQCKVQCPNGTILICNRGVFDHGLVLYVGKKE